MKSISPGIYRDERTGNLYERPRLNGRYTWRKLSVRTLRDARELLEAKRTDQARSEFGLARDPYGPPSATVGALLDKWEAAGCPRRGRPPCAGQLKKEASRLKQLRAILSDRIAEKLTAVDCTVYFNKRKEVLTRQVHGGRAVDLELQTLKAALVWSVQHGLLAANPIPTRPKFGTAPVRHCRDAMPRDAEDLHALAVHLFDDPKSEPLGWQLLLEAMTGCRTNEILRLRWDASSRSQAGYIEGDHMWLNRSKGGVNPFCHVHPDLSELLRWLAIWRNARHPGSPWLIPSTRAKGQAICASALTHALARVGPIVSGAHRTSHGLRAYFVTVRRSQGISDGQIAAEIGDSSGAAIISSTYGSIPPNWSGGEKIGWMPAGEPAWTVLGLPENAVSMYTQRTTAKTQSA